MNFPGQVTGHEDTQVFVTLYWLVTV